MMNPEECRNTFAELSSFMREAGLAWAVEDVEATIRLGKPQTKSVSLLKETESKQLMVFETEPRAQKRSPGKKVELTTSISYSEREKLLMLIAALKQVTINVFNLETEIAKFAGQSSAPHRFEFWNEDTDERELELNIEHISQRSDRVANFEHLVAELEREASAD